MKHDLFGTVQNDFYRTQGQLSDLFRFETCGPESAKSQYFMKIDEYRTKTDYEMLINQSIAYLTLLKLFYIDQLNNISLPVSRCSIIDCILP